MKMFIKKSEKGIGEIWRHQKLTDASVSLGHVSDVGRSRCLYCPVIAENDLI